MRITIAFRKKIYTSLEQQYEKMNGEDHLTAAGNQNAFDEIDARPDDESSVHNSLADIEEDDNYAEAVNG